MTSLSAKALISIGISSAVAGTSGYGIYYFSTTPKTIKEKLVWEGMELLDFSETNNTHSTEWDQKVTKYNETSSNYPKFDDLKSTPNIDATKLRKKCTDVIDMSLSDEKANSILDKIKTWCFKGELA